MSPSSSNLPLFLSLTGRERDEFLRALGLADYDDINLFNLLCSYAAKRATAKVNVPDLLAAVASWARSHRKPNLMGGAAKAALRRVVAALERNGYAATKEDPNTILLRDGERRAGQGDRAILEIEKIYRLIESDPLQSYPSSTSIAVPSTALVPVSYTEFTAELVESHAASTKILRISFADDVDLLLTAAILPRLHDIARRRVHFYIQNNPSLYNFVLYELRKIPQFRHVMDQQRLYALMEHRQETPPLFWVYLSLAVARSRDEDLLEPKFRPGRMILSQSAHLLHSFWQREHRVEQERKRREADEAAVVARIERSGRGFTLEEMADIRDEAGRPLREKLEDARGFLEDLLERQRAEAEAADKVPAIVHFGELWMHRSAVLPLLHDEIRSAADYCRKSVETEWKLKIEQGTVTDPDMNDDEAFGEALRAIVGARRTRLASMLKKPRLVHLLLTEAAEADPGAYRTHGALFEGLDDPTLKRMDRLLGLERDEIVSRIVSGLSLLRRFLLRRRFRTKKTEPGAGARPETPVGTDAPGVAEGQGRALQPEGAGRSPQGPRTVKITRPKKSKPTTIKIERPSRKKGPKTMDEALDKLKDAMHKRRR